MSNISQFFSLVGLAVITLVTAAPFSARSWTSWVLSSIIAFSAPVGVYYLVVLGEIPFGLALPPFILLLAALTSGIKACLLSRRNPAVGIGVLVIFVGGAYGLIRFHTWCAKEGDISLLCDLVRMLPILGG